jgi:ATP-dependent Clp protease ATP-binding subunit ClpA
VRTGHNFVGTEQILLGLIGESTGIAAKVLKSLSVNLKDTRVEVEKIIGRGSGFVAVEIPFTPRAKRVLELSLEEARQLGEWPPLIYDVSFKFATLSSWPSDTNANYFSGSSSSATWFQFALRLALCDSLGDSHMSLSNMCAGHNYIGTEHILLGVLREGDGIASRVLEAMGVNAEKVWNPHPMLFPMRFVRNHSTACSLLSLRLQTPAVVKLYGVARRRVRAFCRDGLLRMQGALSCVQVRSQVIRMVGESQEAVGAAAAGGGSSGSNKLPTLEEYGTNLTLKAEEVRIQFINCVGNVKL